MSAPARPAAWRHRTLLLACGALLAFASPSRAGGPWKVRNDGTVLVWGSNAVAFRIDAGGLGSLPPPQAASQFEQALDAWNATGLVALTVDPTPLPDLTATGSPDTNAANYLRYWYQQDALPGVAAVKVIFDADGTIIEDLFGAGAREDILGLAHIDTPTGSVPPTILEASLIINGASYNGVAPDLGSIAALRSVMTHEIGHALNLGHSALNDDLAGDGDPSNDRFIPTMYPLKVDNEAELAAPHADDSGALSGLFGGGANSIEGRVFRPDGTTPFQGAQVTVRRVIGGTTDRNQSFSSISGFRYIPGETGPPPPANLLGYWRVDGLPAGDYQVCVEQIDTSFSDANGLQVGPLATPPLLPGPEECYDAAESGLASDDPDAFTAVHVAGHVTGIDIALDAQPASDPAEAAPGNNTPGTAAPLAAGSVQTVSGLLTSGDLDFFSIAVNPGDHLRVDIDAAELGYPTDALVGLWNGAGAPVLDGGVPLRSDDAVDFQSGQMSFDPGFERVVDFTGPAIIGVTCFGDSGFTGCVPPAGSPPAGLPYWLRVEVLPDSDGDGIVDVRDVCPNDPFNDRDGDGKCVADGDHCPLVPGPGGGADADSDGIADECDDCPLIPDPTQSNADGDAFGDACDACTDTDGDGRRDPGYSGAGCPLDNCPTAYNPAQVDSDGDGAGNACDPCPFDPVDACKDVAPPQVSFTLPAAGAINVSVSTDVLVFLSDSDVDPGSVDTSTVYLSGPAGKVPGVVSLSEDGSVITFDPVSSLTPGASYTITVRPPLHDRSGNALAAPVSRTFTALGRTDSVTTAAIKSSGGLSDLYGTSNTGAAGAGAADSFGSSVAMLGDVNGDSLADYIFGAPGFDNGANTDAGRATVILGSTSPDLLAGGLPRRIDFVGSAGGQGVGRTVADAGDLDGDGVDDVCFAAPQPSGGGTPTTWTVYGQTAWSSLTFPATVPLGSPTLTNCVFPPTGADYFCGTVLQGVAGDGSGTSLSKAPDAGGTAGVGELLIGAPFANGNTGVAYMVFGNNHATGAPGTLHGATINLTNVGVTLFPGGVQFLGEAAGDQAGASVSLWANPDLGGLDDLMIGAPSGDSLARDGSSIVDGGYLYAIHPLSPGFTNSVQNLSSVGTSIPGVVFLGNETGGNVARSSTGGFDLDGDGFDDIVFAANGSVYVLGGDDPKSTSADSTTGPRQDTSGTTSLRHAGASDVLNAFKTTRFAQTDGLAPRPLAVGRGGDLNGDGFDDLLIGDPTADSNAGRAYIVYGRPGWWPETVSLDDIGTAVPGLRLLAGPNIGLLGQSLSGGGDVNGDCRKDVVVGAPGSGGGAGKVFVFSLVPPPQQGQATALDADGDGLSACVDCNDTDPTVHPGAAEICDGRDNNCDGLIDEGFPDTDADGTPDCRDCAPLNPAIHPGAAEACNEIDDDCNGKVDDTVDADADGYSACSDCNDANASIHPGRSEACNGVDDDCDGAVDEDFLNLGTGCSAGIGACQRSGHYVCTADGATTVCDAAAGPPAAESCNGVDDDCDGAVDEDGDGDGVAVCLDCNDANAGAFATPGEVQNLRFTSASALAWDAPAAPGGTAVRYDLVRSPHRNDDVADTVCVETDDIDLAAADATSPPIGTGFYYLVRAENACPSGQGPLGLRSDGTPRTARSCP